MKKSFLVIFVFGFAMGLANAQSSDKKWGIGAMGGINSYNGDWGNATFKRPSYGFGSLSLHRYLNAWFDIGIQSNYGDYGYYKDPYRNFLGKKLDGALLLRIKLDNGKILRENAKLAPFITGGIGLAIYSGDRINTDSRDFIIPVGAGVKYNLTSWFAFIGQFLFTFTDHDSRDNHVSGNRNDHCTQQSLGVVFSIGRQKDSDHDGVSDIKDRCAYTPKGIAVDNDGCPVDGDGDGIADYLDKCPGISGVTAFNGCPDTDGDGIQDSNDNCPDEKGTAALKGCPDRDNDGIADKDDKCPDVAGIVSNKGCPEVKEETKRIFQKALTGIQFESGSDIIRKTSYPVLDEVVKVMIENPDYDLEINGHTDNQGDEDKNLQLSERRANAVKKYLADKGVEENRMIAKGYGESKPIADNNTTEGRSKNRRVEFKVIF